MYAPFNQEAGFLRLCRPVSLLPAMTVPPHAPSPVRVLTLGMITLTLLRCCPPGCVSVDGSSADTLTILDQDPQLSVLVCCLCNSGILAVPTSQTSVSHESVCAQQAGRWRAHGQPVCLLVSFVKSGISVITRGPEVSLGS